MRSSEQSASQEQTPSSSQSHSEDDSSRQTWAAGSPILSPPSPLPADGDAKQDGSVAACTPSPPVPDIPSVKKRTITSDTVGVWEKLAGPIERLRAAAGVAVKVSLRSFVPLSVSLGLGASVQVPCSGGGFLVECPSNNRLICTRAWTLLATENDGCKEVELIWGVTPPSLLQERLFFIHSAQVLNDPASQLTLWQSLSMQKFFLSSSQLLFPPLFSCSLDACRILLQWSRNQ